MIWGADAANIADIQALGAGTGLRFAGNDITINPSGAADLAAVAALLQTAIRAITGNAFAAVTVAAADGALVVSSVADLLGTGFDDSSAARTLGLGGPGVNILEAMQTETVTAALDRIDLLNPDPYWVAAAPSIASDFAKIDAFRDWVAARPLQGKATIIDVFGSDVLAAAEGASIGARLHAQGGNNIGAIYNGDANQQAGLSYMARFSSVNFSAANSVINGKFLQLPGITPTRLTAAQRTELARKRINVYIPVGSSADTAEGQTFGTWIDVVYWLAWFSDALQTEGYTHIKGSETGIPITDRGLASIADALEAVCEEGGAQRRDRAQPGVPRDAAGDSAGDAQSRLRRFPGHRLHRDPAARGRHRAVGAQRPRAHPDQDLREGQRQSELLGHRRHAGELAPCRSSRSSTPRSSSTATPSRAGRRRPTR